MPRPRKPPDTARRPPVYEVEAAIVAVAEANPTDGYRIVTAWVRRKLGRAINRKRVLRVMRERKLISAARTSRAGADPGSSRSSGPAAWHLDMTSVWVAEHGWCYLNAIMTAAPARSSAGISPCAAAPSRRSP